MNIQAYVASLNQRWQKGNATEHTYRGDLQQLIEDLVEGIAATNEPKRQACGAPDYVLTRKNIPIGYIEAKDIGIDLGSKTHQKQFDRYRASLNNLIFTDYLDFWLYRDGEEVMRVRIAEVQNNQIVALPDAFATFDNMLQGFCTHVGQTIKSSKRLAEMMANKARMLAEVIERALNSDEETQQNSTLKDQLRAFEQILIHDIRPKEFADIYAQTIAYGMFAARLHDTTLHDFSRQEAAGLIPKTNPFLRKLFQYISGYDIDPRIEWIVTDLADIFRATDVKALLQNFGKATQTHDPIIHFYETFLAAYDPKLRKARGVWYTPEPVVNFIVRAVDDILKNEFGLSEGLADTAKVKIKVNTQQEDKRSKTGYKQVEREVHRVQLLDPATGTGTFLAEVVKHIHQKFKGMQGIWSSYVEDHLIPRLNGFELLMASYAMAHLKLDMLLTETGYTPKREQRLNIYLTNSLEEHHQDTGTLFASWLSDEASQANRIKRDAPVMVVLGNPPYSGESANKGQWIMDLMEDYKKEPGGKEKLKERNPKWINDDYVKFMRYGQHFIEKNGEGVLAFINPHGFLDNPTFRGMRWHLLNTYDKIYTIDLHGNSKKKETAPDGSKDENVFDIMQGVSINIMVKTGQKKANELGKLYHYDLYGKRDDKYEFLWKNNLQSIAYTELPNKAPNYFMVQKDFELEEGYNQGFSLNELFVINSVGLVTARDNFTIHDSKSSIKRTVEDFVNLDVENAREKYNLRKDARDWKVHLAQEDLTKSGLSDANYQQINYRPFDPKWTYYTGNSKGFHCMPRGGVMKHFFNKENIGLLTTKAHRDFNFKHVFLTTKISEAIFLSPQTASNAINFPLYLYPNNSAQQSIEANEARQPNLNPEIVDQIAQQLGLAFTPEKEAPVNQPGKGTFAPIDLLDYIYAVLHSPTYRQKYKEFLKIDFPRVPYPTSAEAFWALVALGGELRQIHLLEHPVVDEPITRYPHDGSNQITTKVSAKKDWELYDEAQQLGRIWLNEQQCFEGVPLVAWEFYIGGYQPAQKWLKDRRERTLSFEDIRHYQKIIVALTETHRLMQAIEELSKDF